MRYFKSYLKIYSIECWRPPLPPLLLLIYIDLLPRITSQSGLLYVYLWESIWYIGCCGGGGSGGGSVGGFFAVAPVFN
ncbi:hypothetical protein F4811DRAFT_547713 [Daldinia bambusicola]|nr:hypothetical protein F4811DRAFT_547713 [Daldinia bambusicola]